MTTHPSGASRIELPPVPSELRGDAVACWAEPLVIDTYMPLAPDSKPAFFEQRVYQGSTGAVFPLPFHERVSQEKEPHAWTAVHLENEWLRVVVLPELGGRIHIGYDKVAGYDFFYRNNVIKPALVGLAGPWISGGVEFNWPQHHRPATFLPTDFEIEHEDDGSVTVWCSDHDPFTRMKGMHGIRLRPDSAAIEARVRLYNRTEETQTFLWWANVAAAVDDHYQAFFPTDVRPGRRPREAGHRQLPGRRPAATTASTTPPSAPKRCPTATVSTGTATSRCPPPTWSPTDRGRLLRRLRPRPRCRFRALGGQALSHRARSSGRGATPPSAMPGMRPSPTATAPTSSSWPASSPTTSPISPSSPRARRRRSASSGTRSTRSARRTRPPTQLAVRLDVERRRCRHRASSSGWRLPSVCPAASWNCAHAGGGLLHREAVDLVPGAPLRAQRSPSGSASRRPDRADSAPGGDRTDPLAAAGAHELRRRGCRRRDRTARTGGRGLDRRVVLHRPVPAPVPPCHPAARALLAGGSAPRPRRCALQHRAGRTCHMGGQA